MGFRFRKKIKIAPGISLNLSKSGVSTSVKAGPVSWNSRTQKTSVNLPGPLSYKFDSNKNVTKAKLIEIAKQAGLKGCSKLNKAELLKLLIHKGII